MDAPEYLTDEYIKRLVAARAHLEEHGVAFAPGLTDREVGAAERRFSINFPSDLRWFLQSALPIGNRFPDWRRDNIYPQERLEWPAEGICFDIRNKVFWWPEWGERPESDEEAVAIAMRGLETVPRLIPITGHSYLPSEPCEVGNPVFSVYQSDVIHRGADLAAFLLYLWYDNSDDSLEEKYPAFNSHFRPIRFWTLVAKYNVTGKVPDEVAG